MKVKKLQSTVITQQVSPSLCDRRLLDKVGGTARLSQLVNRTVSAVNIDRYTTIVNEKYVLRTLKPIH